MPPDREQGRDPGERGLERELRDLGARLDYPPTPDLARAARRRIEEEAERTPRRGGLRTSLPSLRWVAAAALLLVLAVPILSPGVRSAMSDLFLMGGMAGSASGGAAGDAADGGREEISTGSGQQAVGGMAASGSAGAAGAEVGAAGGEKTLASPGSGGQMEDAASVSASDEGMEGGDLAASGGGAGSGGGRNDRPVPDVVGMRAAGACGKLASGGYAGYVVETVDEAGMGPGRVVSQRPEAGRRGDEGGTVDLTVSEPFSAEDLRRGSRRGDAVCVDATQ